MAYENLARKEMIDAFLEALKEDRIPWVMDWDKNPNMCMPYNGVTNLNYNGENALILWAKAAKMGYKDPRWCTLKQASSKGWYIKKGEKHTKVSYAILFDKVQDKTITYREYKEIIAKDPDRIKDFVPGSTVHYVFNAEQMTNVPELKQERPIVTDITMNKYITNMIDSIKVNYKEEGDRAFYSPMNDTVTIPNKELFHSDIGYNATVLHELAHSTMHETRLNRNIAKGNMFGSIEYAKEELRAEIASAFISAELGYDVLNNTLDNHKAYIQSWASVLQNDPGELFKAIHEANNITDYLISHGDKELLIEKKQEIEKSKPQKKKAKKKEEISK